MLSRIAYFLCICSMFYASFVFYPSWKNKGEEATIGWDVAGYYWYLPSIFIYKDLKHQSFKDNVLAKYHSTREFPGFKCDNGNYVIRYSSGMAVMYLPFFAVAHFLAPSFGYPQDGFSPPYQFSIQLGGLLIAFLGLWYLRKLFLLFYDDRVVAIVLIALVFGSNYLNYAAISVGMSHSWLFTIYVFLILNTYYFYNKPGYKYAVRIGLLIGLATLIRPTEIISGLIPLLWGIDSFFTTGIKQKFSFLAQHAGKILLAIVCVTIVFSIQLFYWKYVSGHWLVYSYQDQGFNWTNPLWRFYAFNYRSGWLTYSPMLILALIGFIPFLIKGKNKAAVLIFFLVNYYIICSWNFWWIGGRAMVESYAVLLFPFASLTEVAIKHKALKWVLAPFFLLFIYFNLWLTYNEHTPNGLYDPETMNKPYFWRVAGRTHVPMETKKLMDADDLFEGQPRNMKLLYSNTFESDTNKNCDLPPLEGKRSICINKDNPYTPIYSVPRSSVAGHWVRAQATFFWPRKEWNVWAMPQIVIRFTNKNEKVKESYVRVGRFLNEGGTEDIFMDAKIPKEDFDAVGVFFANSVSYLPIEIDKLQIWSFDE